MKYLLSAALLCLPFLVSAREPIDAKMAPRPLVFIENKGQITGTDDKPRADIDLKLKAPGVTIFIGDGQIHYLWKKQVSNRKIDNNRGQLLHPKLKQESEHSSFETYRMDVELVGADINAEPIKEQQQAYYENYFLPQCPGGVRAHTYGKVTYKNIYPNIDWVLYANNGELKYDFIIRPGGRTSDIRLKYKGATKLQLKEGALTARTPMGSITEKKPYSYDAVTKEETPSSFVLHNDELRFAVAASEHTIVIDPVLAWGSYFGDEGTWDFPGSIALDTVGNIFLSGVTASSNAITWPGQGNSYQATIGGNDDAFLAKFDNDGKWIWSTYYGGSNDEYHGTMVRHNNGNLYMTGETGSQTGMGKSTTVHQQQSGGDMDAFVAMFDPNGWLVWGSYFGGWKLDAAGALAINKAGDVYITGSTQSTDSIATAGAFQDTLSTSLGGYDGFVAKFSATGALLWSTYFGGLGNDGAGAISLDTQENVFIAGTTTGSIHCTPGAEESTFQPYLGMPWAVFIAKFSKQGALLYSSHYNAAHNLYSLLVDTPGNVYMGVWTQGGAPIVKMDNDCKVKWRRGDVNAFPNSIRMGNDGYVYVAGITTSSTIATPGSYQPTPPAHSNGFIIKYDTACNKLWASYYGGAWDDGIYDMAIDKKNKLYVCGFTRSGDGIATPGAYKDAHAFGMSSANTDGFFAKWHDTVASVNPVNASVLCAPDTFDLAYTADVTFRTGNTFTAQLSDATGSFANAVNIGSVNTENSGTISCIIPANTTAGNGYRIRVVASTPSFATADNGEDIRIAERAKPVIVGVATACTNDAISLTVTGTISTAAYTWKLPTGSTIPGPKVHISNAAAGDAGRYVVFAVNDGCGYADSVDVIVHPRPGVVKMTTTAPTCAGATLSLDAESDMQNVSYRWAGPAGFTSTEKTPVISAAEPKHAGYYFVFMTSDKGCVSDSNGVFADIVRLEASIKSIPVRTPGDTINLEGSSNTDSVTWSWEGPGGFTSNIQNPILEDIDAGRRGDYFLTISKYGCTARASTHVIVSELIRFNLYPNPNNGRFTIMGNTLKDQLVQMEIVDVAGRAIYRDEVQTFRRHFKKEVNTQGRLSAGSYILRLDVEGKEQDLHFAVGE